MPAPPLFAFDFNGLLPYVPYAVGSGIATLVLFLALSRGRKKSGRGLTAVGNRRAAEAEAADGDGSYSDRRGSVRRDGEPVKIFISSPTFKDKLDSGWVLDRSTGGMRIALTTALAPGSAVQVIAENAPDTTPWVTILIRSCVKTGPHYELGCEFEQTPPWNILLLFG